MVDYDWTSVTSTEMSLPSSCDWIFCDGCQGRWTSLRILWRACVRALNVLHSILNESLSPILVIMVAFKVDHFLKSAFLFQFV